jgi:hypothetical protein
MDHTERTIQSLQKLEEIRRKFPLLGNEITNSTGGEMLPMHWVVMGIVKRCLSTSSALDMLVKEWNMTCARAVLRMQLDTVIRLSAFWLSDDPQGMAQEVMDGKPINKMKDKDGQNLSDSYLVKKLGEKYDWIPIVYKYTSGYIHFSERHLFDPIVDMDEENRIVKFIINDKDYKFPEDSWVELLDIATDCLQITRIYLEGYLLANKRIYQQDNLPAKEKTANKAKATDN